MNKFDDWFDARLNTRPMLVGLIIWGVVGLASVGFYLLLNLLIEVTK